MSHLSKTPGIGRQDWATLFTWVLLLAFQHEPRGGNTMAHDLAMTNGKTAMMFYGKEPWHGLGTKLDHPATAAEAIEAAGLDYQVELAPLVTTGGIEVPQRKAVIRDDTKEVLGVVGNSYIPIQNRQCFGFLDAVVAEGQLEYHTAGALGSGERMWLLAKLPGYIRVAGTDDITEKFLLLSNDHSGKAALRAYYTPVRVVCANTLAIAHQKGRHEGISILHKGDLAAKVRETQKVLGLAERFYDDLEEKINHLAFHQPTSEELQNYFKALYPDPQEGSNSRAENVRQKLTKLFEEGRGQDLPGIRHSTWAAVNAVTEFIDHHRPTRGGNELERADRRLNSQWFGSGAKLKAEAWDLAWAMAI